MMLYVLTTAVLLFSGLLILGLTLLARSRYGHEHAIRDAKNHSIPPLRFWRTAAINSTLSMSMVYAFLYFAGPRLFIATGRSPLWSLAEGIAVLLVYDFFYYLVHRYPFHEWGILRRVHSVHHIARNPTAVDSLYMHPAENAIGLGLLLVVFASLAPLFGGMSVYTFGWVFFVYSLINVVVHAGIDFRGLLFAPFRSFATRHNKHHVNMNGRNYASVTPIWDLVFGTEEP